MKKIAGFLLLMLSLSFSELCFSQTSNSLLAYPNPFEDSVNIHFSLTQESTVSLNLFNNTGQVVHVFFDQTHFFGGSVDFVFQGDSLPDGMYLLKLEQNGSSIVKKIIKKSSPMGIQEEKITQNEKLLYPNPTAGEIKIPIEGKKTIVVLGMDGKIYKSLETEENTFSLGNLAPGAYRVSVLSDKNSLLIRQTVWKEEE